MREPVGVGCDRGEPLRVTAFVDGGILIPDGTVALDGLLAAAVALREELEPPANAEDCTPIEIPIQREPGGRFHLASFSVSEAECFEVDWTNRRFPVSEAQVMGAPSVRRVNIAGGPGKSYRIPRERQHLVDGRLTWWCLGDAHRIRELLVLTPYVGKKRSAGAGRVREWRVEPCDAWGEGFPIVHDGLPMRPLPPDWPGLREDAERATRTLTYPYWANHRRELCAVMG